VRALTRGVRSPRWLAFGAVGAMGLLVQLACFRALQDLLGLHYLVAATLAVELAVLHNFVWHLHWTWGDRAGAPGGLLGRLVRFHLTNGAVSIAGNLVLMIVLVEEAGMPSLLANLTAVAVCAGANFVASDLVVFRAGS
jgi:putative flippase GtrA